MAQDNATGDNAVETVVNAVKKIGGKNGRNDFA